MCEIWSLILIKMNNTDQKFISTYHNTRNLLSNLTESIFWPLLLCWYSFRYQGACCSWLFVAERLKWFYFQMQNIACAYQSFLDYFLLFTGLTTCYDNQLMNTSTLKLIFYFHLIDVSAFMIFLNDVQIQGDPWDGSKSHWRVWSHALRWLKIRREI